MGQKGGGNWDNCNSINNKIFLNKKDDDDDDLKASLPKCKQIPEGYTQRGIPRGLEGFGESPTSQGERPGHPGECN